MILEKSIVDRFWDDGFLHLKNIFTIEEINSLRSEILILAENYNDDNQTDLLSINFLDDVLLDDRILRIMNSLFGEAPMYFGDSDFGISNRDDTGTYHSDNPDRYKDGPDWNDKRYPIIRFGLYLQDHKKNGGGVILGRRTHKKFITNRYFRFIFQEIISFFNGDFKYMNSEVGDIIIWNMKTTHAGNGQFFKLFKKPISKRLSKFIPRFLKSKTLKNRIMLTGTFALEGLSLDRYIDHLRQRKYAVQKYLNQKISDETLNKLDAKNIKYLPVHEQIKRDVNDKKIIFDELDNFDKLYR